MNQSQPVRCKVKSAESCLRELMLLVKSWAGKGNPHFFFFFFCLFSFFQSFLRLNVMLEAAVAMH